MKNSMMVDLQRVGGNLLAAMRFLHFHDKHLTLVMAFLPHNRITPFVTWIHNDSIGGLHDGHYHRTGKEVQADFFDRAKLIRVQDSLDANALLDLAQPLGDLLTHEESYLVPPKAEPRVDGAKLREQYPDVWDSIRQRVCDDDDLSERVNTKIDEMTPNEAFDHYCNWKGFIDWGPTILYVLDGLRTCAK